MILSLVAIPCTADFFLKGVVDIAGSAMDTARQILELQSRHRRLLWEKKISSPIAVGILEQLFYTPVVSIGQTANRFDISYQAASTEEPLDVLSTFSVPRVNADLEEAGNVQHWKSQIQGRSARH